MSQQQHPATNVFDVAKAIAESLKQLDKQHQEQAIRFASESLGLCAPAPAQVPKGPEESPANTASTSTALHTPSTDIKQFTAAKAPKSDQQFAAVAAYYYKFIAPEGQRKDAIDKEELREAARLVGPRKVPGQFALNNAKNSGYLDSAGRGKFKLNTVGENLVAITLPGDDTSVRRRSGRKKTKKKKVTPKKRAKKTMTRKARGKKRAPRGA